MVIAEFRNRILKHRLAASDLDQPDTGLLCFPEDLFKRIFAAGIRRLRFFRIAIGTAEIASGKPDEEAEPSGMGGFALNAGEHFIDSELFHDRNLSAAISSWVRKLLRIRCRERIFPTGRMESRTS